MKSWLVASILALALCHNASAAPVTAPNRIPAPVEKTDADALALLDQSARAYEATRTLDLTFYRGADGFSDASTARLRLSRAKGDVHLQNSAGATAQLWTNDREWLKNQANFVWYSTRHFWKSNLFLGSDSANGLLRPLLGGTNPFRKAVDKYVTRELTVLPAQIVRGQACRGVRLREWTYRNPQGQPREVWQYSDEKVWFRADNSLLWEVRGQRLQSGQNQKIEVQPTILEIRQMRVNSPLGAEAFVYQLPAGTRAPRADERFWSNKLRVGALPVTRVEPSAFEARLGGKTSEIPSFIGRPVLLWFGFPDDNGDLPIARQLERDWAPDGVQIVAVQMESTRQNRDFNFPVVMAANNFDDPIIKQFGLQRAPFTMILARDGTIAALNPAAPNLQPLLLDLLKAPDPTAPAARDAATSQLVAQLLDQTQRRATLKLWRARALPRPFTPGESAQLLALLSSLAPFEASQIARVLASSHAEPIGDADEARVAAIVASFGAAVSGPIPDDEPEFERNLSPRAFVLREFLHAFAQFNGAERATALQTLAQLDEQQNADIPDFAAWITMARALCGDADSTRKLPALIEAETDVSNARAMIRVLAQTAGAEAVPLLSALRSGLPNRFDATEMRNQLRATVEAELRSLGGDDDLQLGFGS